jgi:hypothetical protein
LDAEGNNYAESSKKVDSDNEEADDLLEGNDDKEKLVGTDLGTAEATAASSGTNVTAFPLHTLSAASAASAQQLQQSNDPPSLNAVLIGQLFSALQRIGAEIQQTATVTDKTNNNDQLKPPAAAIANIEAKKLKVTTATSAKLLNVASPKKGIGNSPWKAKVMMSNKSKASSPKKPKLSSPKKAMVTSPNKSKAKARKKNKSSPSMKHQPFRKRESKKQGKACAKNGIN